MASPPKTRSRARATRPPTRPADPAPGEATREASPVPQGGASDGQAEREALLTAAVEEAARLLEADGAMVYLLDPATGHLRFAHDAGINSPRSRRWIRTIDLPIGVGMFGRAVAERAVVVTGNYLADSSFQHAADPDHVVEDIGIQSMVVAPLVAGDEVFGALGTFSAQRDAFQPAQIGLVRALADHAAAAMRNARLIRDLDQSRRELAERADIERSLREIAARISAARDLGAVLQLGVDEAARLLRADGARIDLIDARSGLLRWAYASGGIRPDDIVWPDDPDETLEQGVSGQAVVRGRAFWTGDYINDRSFPHGDGADTYVSKTDVRSAMAAPLTGQDGAFGALTVFTSRPGAWDEADAAVLEAIADEAAIMIRTTRLIEELDRSREALARRADAEQALREIAARITVLRDPTEILQDVVEAAERIVRADGVILDLLDQATGNLHWAMDRGLDTFTAAERAKLWISLGVGATGIAVAENRVIVAGENLASLFPPSQESTDFYERTGFQSMIAAPIAGESGPLGVIEVYSRRRSAFTEADGNLVGALAGQAAIALTNARLIEELARSRGVIERRADAERALREIGAQITAIREPSHLLQRIVDEARRLLRADGAVIDEFEPEEGVLVAAYDAGMSEPQRRSVRETRLHVGEGLAGKAMAERRVIAAGDYLEGDFVHSPQADEMARTTNIGDLIVAPIIGDEGPVGAIEVYHKHRYAFDEMDAAVLGGLADQAAIAITNARLIAKLESSQAALAQRADTERALRDITARIAALREPDVVLRRVVDEAKRLLGTDGAHLTRMSESGDYLVPVVVAGSGEQEDGDWLLGLQFPLDGGINGLAARQGQPVWTRDYLADERIPQEPDDVAVAERLALRGMAAAPLRAPGGEVIGTLAVSAASPREFGPEALDLLQGLADQAAIAITNAALLTRLTESEARYRYLIEGAPDVVWSIGADARLTFISDAVTRLTGRRPEELIGQHFGALVHESSREIADFDWTTGMRSGSQEVRGRVNLAGADGQPVPAEFIAAARLDEEGNFLGANGSVRDMREQDRLERELRDSEQRYRFLVENSPDVVFATDAGGNFTFMSDSMERVSGWRPDELIGEHYSKVVDADRERDSESRWEALIRDPTVEQIAFQRLRRPDGSSVPVEISAIGIVDEEGKFAGIHGSSRDISERSRLEAELRRQAGELAAGEERAHLARELHDSVTQALFSMTLVSRSVEMLLDRDVDAAREQLTQLRELQREALAEMRALIFELRPGNLEQEGLVRALRTHTAAIQGRIGLAVVVDSALDERLPLVVEEVLYRIAQEALHNVIKHAAARQVRVEVGRVRDGVRLRIHDDGRGFDPSRVPEGHLGLTGMRARADRIGGEFSVRSEIGRGTTVQVFVSDAAMSAAGPVAAAIESEAIRES